ncbi:MAG: chemotaxis protein CheD [Eubacterium sp.]|nr:chemotaxis protein CheD [Eubacterium sp.]
MRRVIRVGMADFKVCSPPNLISTLGLGSCLGVVLYDSDKQICGLAHVMLPDSRRVLNIDNRMKFADTCLHDMYNEMLKRGAKKERMVAKIAGGAKMFSFESSNEFLNIGEQNQNAVKEKIAEWSIPITAEDIGRDYSRSITFDPANGELHIRAVGKGEYII